MSSGSERGLRGLSDRWPSMVLSIWKPLTTTVLVILPLSPSDHLSNHTQADLRTSWLSLCPIPHGALNPLPNSILVSYATPGSLKLLFDQSLWRAYLPGPACQELARHFDSGFTLISKSLVGRYDLSVPISNSTVHVLFLVGRFIEDFQEETQASF